MSVCVKCFFSSSFSSPYSHLLLISFTDLLAYSRLCVLCPSSLIWHFSALKPIRELTPVGEHSFQVNIQAVLPDVQLTKSITVQYFCPVLPPADHYYTQGFLTSQWKLVKIIGHIYLNTRRRAKLFFFSLFLVQIDDCRRWL